MFEVTPLQDGRTLVEGTDVKGNQGSTVLWSPSWAAVVQARKQQAAVVEFDTAVSAFFAPLTNIVDKLNDDNTEDDFSVVTFGDDVEGQQSEPIHLDKDGLVLRILAEGDSDLLRWVGQGTELVVVKTS